ncbi:MAG: hypothetical protein ACYC61_16455 [Isosphaeraceae bacterium]
MVNAAELAWSLVLAIVAVAVAAMLALSVWWDRRTRKPGLFLNDYRHFVLQDIRRTVGIVCLALLAPGLYFGSRVPVFVAEPVAPGQAAPDQPVLHPNRVFLGIWLAVFVLVAILLALALIDWVATRRYARRQRSAMSLERLDILREGMQHQHDIGPDGPLNGSA